jgi:hypothetical protein
MLGDLISLVVLTAGHCTDGVGLDGEETTSTGGDGGKDIWVNFDEVPSYAGIPLSSAYIPDMNQRALRGIASTGSRRSRTGTEGTAMSHPEFNPAAFFLFDLGVVILDEPVNMGDYGELCELRHLDSKEAKKALYTPVGYGLNASGPQPQHDQGGDERYRATVKLVNVNGTFGIPDGTSVKFSSNNGQPHTGGTCFGDSGGPIFREGTLEIVAVVSFGISSTCSGSSGGYRIDQADDLGWLESILD